MSGPFSGRTKIEFCRRLNLSWEDLADALEPEIPRHERRHFCPGRKCEDLWGWLEDRNRLEDLPNALQFIGRDDLAQLLESGRRGTPPTSGARDRLQENLAQSGITQQTTTSQGIESTDWDELRSALADLAEQQMDAIRDHVRAGRLRSALEQVDTMKQRIFDKTPPAHQSQLLRLEATLRLSMAEPLDVIEALASQAKALSPHQGDHLLAVRLVDARQGNQAAMEFLGEPKTLFESHYHATLLLELGSPQPARQWLEGPIHQEMLRAHASASHSFQRAETERLLALAHLFDRDLGQAQLHIERAMGEDPGSELIRFAQGCIYYCRAISPALIPDRPEPFPQPSRKGMLRDSSENRTNLDRAAELFRVLSQNQETTPSRCRVFEAWWLATLASHPGRHEEGGKLCRKLLQRNPAHPEAIVLNTLAGFGLSMEKTVKFLERRMEEQQITSQEVLSLLWLRFQNAHPKTKRLVKIMEKSRSILAEAGLEQSWQYWDVLLQAHVGGSTQALERIQLLDSEPVRLELDWKIRELEARKSGEWRPAAESLLRLFQATGDGAALFSACRILADAGAWERVASQANELVQRVATAAALDLAAVALWHQQAFQECLALLDESWGLLPSHEPPVRLCWMRAQCLRRLGHMPAAIREAEEIYRRDPSMQYGSSLFDQYVEGGDLKQAAVLARNMLSRSDVSADFLLHAALVLRREETRLAKMLLLRAKEVGISDHLVTKALELAFGLGADEEFRNVLIGRISRLATVPGSGVGMINSIQEMKEHIQARQRAGEKAIQMYRQGQIWLHPLCTTLNISMPLSFYRAFQGKERPVGDDQAELFIRHGNRSSLEAMIATDDNRTLFLDVTAMLLADRLDLLDLVEQSFRPLAIAADLQLALLQMRDQFGLSSIRPIGVQEEERNALFDNLGELIERLRVGIEKGIYRVIPLTHTPLADSDTEDIEESIAHPMERVLYTMLASLPKDQRFFVWCDDRCLSGFFNCDGQPMVGILEILSALEMKGVLAPEQRFRLQHRLRVARLLYLPLEAKEVAYHLRQAPYGEEEGEIQETAELVTLRQYLARILTNQEHLQMPHVEENRVVNRGEMPILFSFRHVVTQSLLAIWEDETVSERHRNIMMNWVWKNLGFVHPRGLYGDVNITHQGIVMADLFCSGLVHLYKEVDLPRLRAYLHWLYHRLLLKISWSTPGFLSEVVEQVKKYILVFLSEFDEQSDRSILAQHFFRSFSQALPTPIRKELFKDPGFFDKMGLPIREMLPVGEHRFEYDVFWRAVADVVTHGQGKVQALDLQSPLTLRVTAGSDGEKSMALLEEGDKELLLSLEPAIFPLFLSSPLERVNHLKQHRSWFDCPSGEFARIVADLATIEDPPRRLEQVQLWRDQAPEIFYQQLQEEMNAGGFELSPQRLLPPSGSRWLRSMRLDVDATVSFAEQWADAAARLLQEEGLETALARMMGLPLALPVSLLEALAKMEESDRGVFLLNRANAAATPLDRIHLLRLLLQFNVASRDDPARGAWMGVLQDLLTSAAQEETQAFTAILKWVNAAARPWPEASHWPAEIRLAFAWSHARRLHALLKAWGTTDHQIVTYFDQAFDALKSALLFPTRNLGELDAAHPIHLDQDNLLLFGLGHALEAHWEAISSHGEIVRQLAEVAFLKGVEKDLIRLPDPSALLDVTLASNGFSSFMGNDSLTWLLDRLQAVGRGESSVVWTAQWRADWRENALTQLEQDQDGNTAWALLWQLQGNLPLPREACLRLTSLVEKTDFSMLCRTDPLSGSFALLVASHLIPLDGNAERAARIRMEGQLSSCLEAILSHRGRNGKTSGEWVTGSEDRQEVVGIEDLTENSQDKASEDEKALMRFFNAILKIAVITDDPERSAEHFGGLLSQLCEHHSGVLAPLLRPILQHLVENLPMAIGHHLWKPLLLLRAV
ncbi:MAG: hypothetical protein H7839_11705 [Magnetococcus sp. YQC-5]